MSRAKRFFMIFSALVVVIGAGLLWYFRAVNKAQNEAFNSIAEPMIRELVSSSWSANSVYKYASPRLKQRIDEIPKFMTGEAVKPLWTGKMTEYDGVQGAYLDKVRNVISVTAKVAFDYNNILTYPPCGYSYITLVLRKNNDKWSLDGFAIDSPVYQGLYTYGFVEDLRLPTLEEILLDLRWFTGNDSLRPGCLFSAPYSQKANVPSR